RLRSIGGIPQVVIDKSLKQRQSRRVCRSNCTGCPASSTGDKAFMKPLVMLILLSLLCFASPQSQQPTYESLKTEAERLYAEASYSQARELYLKARSARLQPEEARWVEFRLADTLWRAQAATQTADSTKYETAQRRLESLISARRRVEDHDRI